MKFIACLALLGSASAITSESFLASQVLAQKGSNGDVLEWWKHHIPEKAKLSKADVHAAIEAAKDDGEYNDTVANAYHLLLEIFFDHVDADHNGTITKKEVFKAADEDLVTPKTVIHNCDKDGKGTLSLDEMNSCIDLHVDKERQGNAKAFVKYVWKHVDTSKDGKLSEKELVKAFEKYLKP